MSVVVKVEAIELYRDAVKCGCAMVRAFMPDRPRWVAPRRYSLNAALLDVMELERTGLHSFWVTYPSRGFRVYAASAEIAREIARDIAHDWWSDLGWPTTVEYEQKVADVVEHPDAEVIRERVTA